MQEEDRRQKGEDRTQGEGRQDAGRRHSEDGQDTNRRQTGRRQETDRRQINQTGGLGRHDAGRIQVGGRQ